MSIDSLETTVNGVRASFAKGSGIPSDVIQLNRCQTFKSTRVANYYHRTKTTVRFDWTTVLRTNDNEIIVPSVAFRSRSPTSTWTLLIIIEPLLSLCDYIRREHNSPEWQKQCVLIFTDGFFPPRWFLNARVHSIVRAHHASPSKTYTFFFSFLIVLRLLLLLF